MSTNDDPYLDLLKKCLAASLYDESSWQVVEGTPRAEQRSLASPYRFFKGRMRKWLVGFLRKKKMLLVKREAFDPALREEGKDWPCFGYTMAGHRRLENVQACVKDVLEQNVPGDFIETGAWRGGTTIFMRALLKSHGITDRTVWVADSFEGLPPPDSDTDGPDLSDVDHLKVSLPQVKANFARFDLLDDQVKFLQGWFCDTLPKAPIERLSILRLDGDMYSSTMDALKNLYDRVSPGGYVIVDDYYSWESCRRAVTEFLQERKLDPKILPIDWTGAYWKVEAKA